MIDGLCLGTYSVWWWAHLCSRKVVEQLQYQQLAPRGYRENPYAFCQNKHTVHPLTSPHAQIEKKKHRSTTTPPRWQGRRVYLKPRKKNRLCQVITSIPHLSPPSPKNTTRSKGGVIIPNPSDLSLFIHLFSNSKTLSILQSTQLHIAFATEHDLIEPIRKEVWDGKTWKSKEQPVEYKEGNFQTKKISLCGGLSLLYRTGRLTQMKSGR